VPDDEPQNTQTRFNTIISEGPSETDWGERALSILGGALHGAPAAVKKPWQTDKQATNPGRRT
jgi:hypothetical protein